MHHTPLLPLILFLLVNLDYYHHEEYTLLQFDAFSFANFGDLAVQLNRTNSVRVESRRTLVLFSLFDYGSASQ